MIKGFSTNLTAYLIWNNQKMSGNELPKIVDKSQAGHLDHFKVRADQKSAGKTGCNLSVLKLLMIIIRQHQLVKIRF